MAEFWYIEYKRTLFLLQTEDISSSADELTLITGVNFTVALLPEDITLKSVLIKKKNQKGTD